MNSILRIYVSSTLNAAAQHTEVLTVTYRSHDQVHYFLGFRVDVNKSHEIYYSFDSH